ncbi:MAG TPA: hypothetical protein VGK46_06160 [Saprospiraceae bacterium]
MPQNRKCQQNGMDAISCQLWKILTNSGSFYGNFMALRPAMYCQIIINGINLMGVNYLLVLSAVYLFFSCGKCEEDQFGEKLELIVPINTTPSRDTFGIGDTLWIEAIFSKHIEVNNVSDKIRLDGFNFFTDLVITEISDTVENNSVHIDTIVKVGKLEYLPLSTLIVYPITFKEDQDSYSFMAGVSFKENGLYLINFNTDIGLFEYPNYEHPALYACEGNRRDQVIVKYKNQSTSIKNYSTLFRKTKVDYLLNLVDFDEYRNQGCITIIVL